MTTKLSMKEKKTTATVNKVDALHSFETALKNADKERAALVSELKKQGKVLPSGPWDRLHHFDRWTPEGLAKLYNEVKSGKSNLIEEDQKYILEICKDIEPVNAKEDGKEKEE